MGTTFLCFHSLSQDLWGSCLMGDLNHLNKTSWRWADTTQEVPGDEECAPPPQQEFISHFSWLSHNQSQPHFIASFSFSFSSSALNVWNQSQEKQDPATERVNCSRLIFSNELIAFTTLMRWNKHIRVAGCRVWGLVFKVSPSVRTYPCKFHLEIKVFIAAKLLECISANYFQLHNINRKKWRAATLRADQKICMGRGEVCVYRSNGFQEASNRRRFPSCLPFTAGVTALEPASETKLCFEVIFLPTGKIRGNPTACAHTVYTHIHKDLVTVI